MSDRALEISTDVVIEGIPAWLPEEVRDRTWSFQYRYSRAERNVYRKRHRIPVSQWAEKHRVITMGAVLGQWKNSTTPYLTGIMDASFFPSVETVIICAADQVGKSECVNNCIGYAIDRDPGPVLYVYPDEQTARENSRDRILPMIESSGRLKGYLTGQEDDAASFRISLQHMPIYMAWARSAARLANKPIKYLVFDETDKYPDTAGKREASPIRKGEKRLRTYRHSRKTWKLSTPTIESGPIWQALIVEAEVIFDFHVVCPACGRAQRMTFDGIKWPKDARDSKAVELEDLARYECEQCKTLWDDHMRNIAVAKGEWKERERNQNPEEEKPKEKLKSLNAYLVENQPHRIGFHIPSWLSRFVGLSEVAAAFLRGLADKNELKDFNNSHAAEPWKEYRVDRKEDLVLTLRDERPMGLVPGGGAVACLTAGVDTQDNGFWYEVRAWGWGMTLESWQVRAGFVDTFEAVEKILFEEQYKDADGLEHFVRVAVQDAMGHKTAEVYDFARKHRGRLLAFRGERRMTQPWAFSKIDTYPGTNKVIPGGLQLLRADTNYFKNQLSGKLEIAAADPGAWHLCAETTEEWARHMCAEYIDEKTQYWECPESKANHGWDCSVYNLVAADVLRVKYWKKEGARSQEPGARIKTEEKQRPGWVGNREGWLGR